MKIKRLAKAILPPILTEQIQRRYRDSVTYSAPYADWASAEAAAKGYGDSLILDKVLEATNQVLEGAAAFERDGMVFEEPDHQWHLLTMLFWVLARRSGQLNLLDFGGALGSTYLRYRQFLKPFHVAWQVVEQPHFVNAGRDCLNVPGLSFVDDIDNASGAPDVCLFGCVLQYLAKPYELLDALSNSSVQYLIFDRMPLTQRDQDVVVLQEVPPALYAASYPVWLLSRQKFFEHLARDWQLVMNTPADEGSAQTSDGIDFRYEGYLFERR